LVVVGRRRLHLSPHRLLTYDCFGDKPIAPMRLVGGASHVRLGAPGARRTVRFLIGDVTRPLPSALLAGGAPAALKLGRALRDALLVGDSRHTVERRRFYRALNVVMRVLLRSRLHQLRSDRVLLLEFGRRSGKQYSLPVSFWQPDENQLVCLTSTGWSAWSANLDNATVHVWLRGSRRADTPTFAVRLSGVVCWCLPFSSTTPKMLTITGSCQRWTDVPIPRPATISLMRHRPGSCSSR
jgi:hypothetical protein